MKTIRMMGPMAIMAALAMPILNAPAQETPGPSTAPPATPAAFYQTALSYFTTFNPELDSTFGSQKGQAWTGVDSIQGASVPLADSLGLSYNVYGNLAAESVTRNAGIAGVLLSQQIGVGYSVVVHDAKFTLYVDGGYNFEKGLKSSDKIFAEVGARVQKALTTHTFAYVGIAAQLPKNIQVFSAGAGFTF